MLNTQQLKSMYQSAKTMGLGSADTMEWLWSYYASRVPGSHARSKKLIQLTLADVGGKPLHLLMRTNGWDWRIVEEIFVLHSYRLQLDHASRILDLGGNMGLSALYFERAYPGASVVTVEPIPENLDILRQNLKLNQSKIEVIPSAVSAQDGKLEFQLSEYPAGHSSVMNMLPTGEHIQVDSFSVPTIMKRIGWDSIDLLKIDIEGSEAEVLGGDPSWLNQVRCIIGEGHFGAGYTIDACRRDLEPMGFEVELLDQKEFVILFLARRR